jgi:hypothetical protein
MRPHRSHAQWVGHPVDRLGRSNALVVDPALDWGSPFADTTRLESAALLLDELMTRCAVKGPVARLERRAMAYHGIDHAHAARFVAWVLSQGSADSTFGRALLFREEYGWWHQHVDRADGRSRKRRCPVSSSSQYARKYGRIYG